MGEMKTCIYTICKNEKHFIRRFLRKHKDSDYICLLDTGSTDGTYEFLLKEALKNDRLIVNQVIFKDFRFDSARNECLKLIPKDVDICIKIDIDEYLSKDWKSFLEKSFKRDKDFYGFYYVEHNGIFTCQSKVILASHLNKNDIKWRYPVHEDLYSEVSSTMDNSVFVEGVTITHTPLHKRKREKIRFYNDLLGIRKKEYFDENTLFYALYELFQEDKCKDAEVLSLISELLSSDLKYRKDVETLCRFAFFIYSNDLDNKELRYIKTLYKLECSNKINFIDFYIYKRIISYFKPYKYYNFINSNNKEFVDFHILRESIDKVIPYISEVSNNLDDKDNLLEYKKILLSDTNELLSRLFSNVRSLETCTPLKRLAIEILLTDNCNLNCAYCNHFAPLAKPHSYALESYIRDIKRLKELFGKDIWDIKLMGGEPLLHPDIEEVIKETRNTFKESNISILTNGLLLPKMKDSFWKICKSNNIKISITKYKDTPDKEILNLVHKYNVSFEYYPNSDESSLDKNNMVKFCVNENGDTDVVRRFLDCGNANKTITLRDGKLYTCPFKATVCHFNRYFNSQIPVGESDFIELYKAKDKDTIYRFLSKPTNTCKYCYGECSFVNWKRSERVKEEWTLTGADTPKFMKDSYLNKLLDKGNKNE